MYKLIIRVLHNSVDKCFSKPIMSTIVESPPLAGVIILQKSLPPPKQTMIQALPDWWQAIWIRIVKLVQTTTLKVDKWLQNQIDIARWVNYMPKTTYFFGWMLANLVDTKQKGKFSKALIFNICKKSHTKLQLSRYYILNRE